MNLKRIFVILTIVITLLACFVVALTNVDVNSPITGQNVSGNLVLNATISDGDMNDTLNVTFYFFNGGVLVYNNTIYNSSALNNSKFNITIDTASVIVDGTYNLTVNASNASTTVTNTSVTTVTIDNTAPAVAITAPTTGTFYTNSTLSILLNATITDAIIGVNSALFQVSNGTVPFNITATNITSFWNATLNISLFSLAEANHTVTVFANDTLNNLNSSVTVNIIYDYTVPVINLVSVTSITDTGAALTVNATDVTSGVANCTYSSPGAGTLSLDSGNISAGSYGGTLSSLSADTTYVLAINCTDKSGNVANNGTYSFSTTSPAAAATSSSGGGGGSASSQVTGQFSKMIWDQIEAEETARVSVTNGEIGVTEVRFDVSKKLYGMWMKVEKKDSLPSAVKDFELKAYRYIEITKSLAFKEGDILNPEIDFKIEKSWLTDEGLSKNNIGLFRYVDNVWTGLVTTISKEDADYVYYTAETPGFSYFAIGQKEVAAPVVAEEPASPEAQPVAEVGEEAVAEPTAAPEEAAVKKSSAGTMVLVLVILLVVVGLVWWFVKNSKSNSPNQNTKKRK